MSNEHIHHYQRDGSIFICQRCGTAKHRNGKYWWAGRYSESEPPCGDDVVGQDAWFETEKARKDEMKNRKARLLIAKPGQLIRISNRLVVRYRYPGFREWSSIRFYGVWRNRSAAQNRWKNHGM